MDDAELMQRNVERIHKSDPLGLRVSSEHYLWLAKQIAAGERDMKRLWHFAGCPYDHCKKCIDDAAWIKSLQDRLGPPSAASVQAQHDAH